MPVQLNHTIVHAHDKEASARFLSEILGVSEPPKPFAHFLGVEVDNGVTLDFLDAGDYGFQTQHYAFLVGEAEFDEIFGRIVARGLPYWADPGRNEPGQINRHFGGRGVYWEDPNGHLLEIITRPYGDA